MTVPIKKTIPSPLELNYAEMKKQSGGKNPSAARNKMEGSISSMPEDTITLSSGQSEQSSQPVTTIEKQALQIQISVYA